MIKYIAAQFREEYHHLNLFLIRFCLAAAFYICVTLSSQTSVLAGIILVVGYRSFLALSPYINKLFHKRDLLFSIILAIVGVLCYFVLELYIFGALLIAFGLSVGGFILKAIAAETPSMSGINKIAITSGNIGAGGVLFLTNNNNIKSFAILLLFLVVACFLKMPGSNERSVIKPLTIKMLVQNKLSNLVWFFFGMAIGIRVFGMYIIMPNYLIRTLGFIPDWYGLTLILYGFIVILTQLPAIGKKVSFSLTTSIIALGFSCFIMGTPNIFCVETFIGAMLWCFCLALEEIFAPFIDFHAVRANHLLVKEISIAIGGAICFLFTLTNLATEALSAISIVFISIGYLIYRKNKN